MSRFAFSEYDSASGPVHLHVLIRAEADSDLTKRLLGLDGCLEVEAIDAGLLAVRVALHADTDDFLQLVARLVDQAGAAIVEARLCPAVGPDTEQVEITSQFTALAAGVDANLRPDHNYLFLEPGTSFGSGRHPSTRLAVQALQELAVDEGFDFTKARVLDIGCGSGILALVCARLGAASVLGLDISPEAVSAARKNVNLNALTDRIVIADSSLAEIEQRFDVLVANISPFVLQEQVIPLLAGRLAPQGHIVLAGMREAQLAGLLKCLQEAGMRGRPRFYEEGLWRSLWLDSGRVDYVQDNPGS